MVGSELDQESCFLIDGATGGVRYTLGYSVKTASFGPDGKMIALGTWDKDNSIVLVDVGSGDVVHTLRGHSLYVDFLALGLDGRTLISGNTREGIMWDVKTGERIDVMPFGVQSAEFSRDGKYLAVGLFAPRRVFNFRLWLDHDPAQDWAALGLDDQSPGNAAGAVGLDAPAQSGAIGT